MAKIAVIGICGKSVFMSVDHFHSDGETLIADGIYEEMGGKGFNQSIAAARMGAEVSFLAAVGDDLAADECENILHNNKIKPCLMRKKGKNILDKMRKHHGERAMKVLIKLFQKFAGS